MLRIERFFMVSLAKCVTDRPSGARAVSRWVLIGVLFTFLLGFGRTTAAPAQEPEEPERQQGQQPQQRQQRAERQEQPEQEEQPERQERRKPVTDWATDNLDMVSASPLQIKEVLTKLPGMMVELKRLMAKQAIEKGQIVAEQDLEDDAIIDRLTTDARFRALATRLLQRYGYLSPELNPLSPSGREQDLLMRARAERLARATPTDSELGPGWRPSQAECEQDKNNPGCLMEASRPELGPESESSDAACEPDEASVPCQTPASRPGTYANPDRPVSPGREETPPPDIQQPERANSSLMLASAISSSGQPRSNMEPGTLRSEQLADVTAGIPPVLPESPLRQPQRTTVSPYSPKASLIPDPVQMVRSPNPYAYLPSLYDLYMQATPRTGRLERFGLDVFRRRDLLKSGIPMDLPAGPEYVLGPGDGLTIDLWGGVSQRMFRTVDREGRLALPEAGPLLVSGKTLGDVQEVVQRILRTQYRDVSADISLGRLRTVRIYVVGEVVSPGAYDISSLSTPLNALFAAGGVTSRGSLRHLRHSRGRQLVEEVDAYDLLLHGVRGDLKNLENGDTLLVPPVGAQVSVDGMVRRPAVYEMRGETNLQEALDLAGGVLPAAALRHIEVQRLEAHEARTMLSVNVGETSDPRAVERQLAAFAVHDGDEVHIFPIAPYNTAAVYLQGHVLRPGRYAYTPGMRLTDLVASYQDLLPEPAAHYAEIVSLRQPDWRPVVESFDLAAALANPQASPKLAPLDTVRILGRYDVEAAPTFWLSGEVRNPGQYRTSGQMHLRDAIYQGGGLLADASRDSAQLFRVQPDGSLRILNVNLAAALDADPLENVLVQPHDRIIVHRSLYRVDPPSVYIRGEVANPGRYPLGENMRVTDLLDAAGGPKRSANLANGDLTRYVPVSGVPAGGEHQSVNLIAAAHDENLNFPLKDGDVLSVPQLPGWKDLGASITLKGEIKNPGVYGIRPGEHLSSILKRAGGLLPTAYPQGAIFMRVSVRELQEKSRLELIQRVEQEGAAVKTSLQTTGSEQAQLAQEAAQQQQRVLEALRRATASGRLVIQMRPDLKGFEHSPQDIEVRGGDSLEIPKQPGVVLVIGQVYNTNAITYVPGKNAGWYLSQSGGATRLADKGAIFIVRANGEIASRHRRQEEWWSSRVLSATVRPGDTIVVPERPVIGDTHWKNVIAIAQIAEAAAITAAVIP
jgi:protein involved in polysaccharide export with SLBB domain